MVADLLRYIRGRGFALTLLGSGLPRPPGDLMMPFRPARRRHPAVVYRTAGGLARPGWPSPAGAG